MSLWPADPDHSYRAYISETLDLSVWGGQQQIIVAAHIWQVRIHVHTPFGIEVYGDGPSWHLVYASDPVGHYDVLTPDEISFHRGPAAPPTTLAPILPPHSPPLSLSIGPLDFPQGRQFIWEDILPTSSIPSI